MDVYHEYMVKKPTGAKEYIITISVILSALALTFIIFSLGIFTARYIQFMPTLALFLIAFMWWGAVRLIRMSRLEYEYILTNHELDIDRIAAKTNRKRLITVNFRNIICCANVDDEKFNENKNFTVKDYSVEGHIKYFVDYSNENGGIRVIFCPSENILKGIRMINPKCVFIKYGDISQ